MNEGDLPSTQVNDDRGVGWGGPPPRRRSRRGGIIAAVAGLLVVAALAVAAIHVGHLLGTPAGAVGVPSSTGTGGFGAVSQPPRTAAHATASAIAATVDPGLVDINVTFGHAGARGAATGMVLTQSGVVLTNNHVVEGATSIRVTDIGNGRTYGATVVGYDRTSDVAVLQLQGAAGLQTVSLGDSSKVTTGTKVTAIGNAGGVGGTPRVARGSVTALDQTITASDAGGGNMQRLSGLIQTNAAIRPGDSGGPLVNGSGQVIGMDAAASASFVARPASTEGYAIPINEAISIGKQIEAGVASSTVHVGPTGFLGVEIIPPAQLGGGFGSSGPQHPGAFVGGVLAGYPAAKAGLQPRRRHHSARWAGRHLGWGLPDLLSAHHPGDSVQLQWIDPAGRTHSATVTLASGPAA